jgi:hypothetical protein
MKKLVNNIKKIKNFLFSSFKKKNLKNLKFKKKILKYNHQMTNNKNNSKAILFKESRMNLETKMKKIYNNR